MSIRLDPHSSERALNAARPNIHCSASAAPSPVRLVPHLPTSPVPTSLPPHLPALIVQPIRP